MVPLVIIHFGMVFLLINHPFVGTPMAMETPIWGFIWASGMLNRRLHLNNMEKQWKTQIDGSFFCIIFSWTLKQLEIARLVFPNSQVFCRGSSFP